jgi:microcystin-dependent protein
MTIDYGDFIALAAVETPRRVRLSANSLTLFQSAFQWLRNPREWEDDTDPLSELEEDARDAMVALAFDELLEDNVDIGLIFPFVTTAPPANSLECDGTHYLRVDYPELYAALDSAFVVDADHFKTPDMRGRVPLGVGTGSGLSTYAQNDSGGAENHALTTAELASHGHTVNDPTHGHAITDPGHVHTVTDPGHGHSMNNPTHTHGLTDPGHVHTITDPTHHHSVNSRGASAGAYFGGSNSGNVAAVNTTDVATGISIDNHTTGASVNAAAANQTANNATTGLTVNSHTTGISEALAATGVTVQNTGSGNAHENRQPYLALRFALWAK